jgi:hypothetical protein
MQFRIEGHDFEVEGPTLEMPNALPVVVLTEEAATQLCLELGLQVKMVRDIRSQGIQNVANLIREEYGLPPLDPPDSITGYQRR